MQRHLLSPGGQANQAAGFLVFLVENFTDKPFHPGISTLDIQAVRGGPRLCMCVCVCGQNGFTGTKGKAAGGLLATLQ